MEKNVMSYNLDLLLKVNKIKNEQTGKKNEIKIM